MAHPKQDWLLKDSTTASSTPTKTSYTATEKAVDVRDVSSLALFASCTGGTSIVFTVQVTTDPNGLTGWADANYREPGAASSAYAKTAVTLVPATARSLFLDPADNIAWIRLAVTANTGPTTATVRLVGER